MTESLIVPRMLNVLAISNALRNKGVKKNSISLENRLKRKTAGRMITAQEDIKGENGARNKKVKIEPSKEHLQRYIRVELCIHLQIGAVASR